MCDRYRPLLEHGAGNARRMRSEYARERVGTTSNSPQRSLHEVVEVLRRRRIGSPTFAFLGVSPSGQSGSGTGLRAQHRKT